MKKNEKGFGLVETLLVLILITLVGFVGWSVWHSNNKSSKPVSSVAHQSDQTNKSVDGVLLSKDYLPFTLRYPNTWEIRSESPTNYGFDAIELQAKGSVVETGNGEDLKSGALINIMKTSDRSTNPETSVEEYASSSQDAKFLKNKRTFTVDGIEALAYDLDRTADSGTSLHQVRFYKDSVLYVLYMDNRQYTQPQYKAAFDTTVKSIHFK